MENKKENNQHRYKIRKMKKHHFTNPKPQTTGLQVTHRHTKIYSISDIPVSTLTDSTGETRTLEV